MKPLRALLLFMFCMSLWTNAQVQPNPVPGLPGIGVSYGMDTAGDIQSILVYQSGKQVQTLPVCTAQPVPQKSPLGSLNMADFNFDSFYDLLLQVTDKGDNFNFCVWIYNPRTHRFDASPQLSALVNPRPHPENRTITSFTNQGCQGGCHEQKTFVWSKGQLKLTRIDTQVIDQGAPVNGPGCLYTLTVQEEKKGKMTLISRDRVNSMGSKVCP